MVIEGIIPTSVCSLRVRFADVVKSVEGVLNPDSYIISDGLEVVAVIVSGEKEVELITTKQEQDHCYTVQMKNWDSNGH